MIQQVNKVFLRTLLLTSAMTMVILADDAQYNSAITLYNAKQYKPAVQLIGKALTNANSEDIPALLSLQALCLEASGDPENANKTYSELIQKYPSSKEASEGRLRQISLCYDASQWQQVSQNGAQLNLDQLEKNQQHRILMMMAVAAEQLQQLDSAITLWKKALEKKVDASIVLPRLLNLYRSTARHKDLLELSRKGIPNMAAPDLAVMRTESLYVTQQYSGIEAEVIKVPLGHKDYSRMQLILANTFVALQNLPKAIAPLQAALKELSGTQALHARHLLITTLLQQKDVSAAEEIVSFTAQLKLMKLENDLDWKLKLSMLQVQSAMKSDKQEEALRIIENILPICKDASRRELQLLQLEIFRKNATTSKDS